MKRKIRTAMLNLHIGGAVSVFFICASLLAGDFWFNERAVDKLNISESQAGSLESSPEFVLSMPMQFFFIQQPGMDFGENVNEATTFAGKSWVEANVHSMRQSLLTPRFALDGNAGDKKK